MHLRTFPHKDPLCVLTGKEVQCTHLHLFEFGGCLCDENIIDNSLQAN